MNVKANARSISSKGSLRAVRSDDESVQMTALLPQAQLNGHTKRLFTFKKDADGSTELDVWPSDLWYVLVVGMIVAICFGALRLGTVAALVKWIVGRFA